MNETWTTVNSFVRSLLCRFWLSLVVNLMKNVLLIARSGRSPVDFKRMQLLLNISRGSKLGVIPVYSHSNHNYP